MVRGSLPNQKGTSMTVISISHYTVIQRKDDYDRWIDSSSQYFGVEGLNDDVAQAAFQAMIEIHGPGNVRTMQRTTEVTEDMRDVHTEHCCVFHGCKYSHNDCSVEHKTKNQSYMCEDCEYELNNGGLDMAYLMNDMYNAGYQRAFSLDD